MDHQLKVSFSFNDFTKLNIIKMHIKSFHFQFYRMQKAGSNETKRQTISSNVFSQWKVMSALGCYLNDEMSMAHPFGKSQLGKTLLIIVWMEGYRTLELRKQFCKTHCSSSDPN